MLDAVAHRPFPLPDAPWIGRQTWCDLMFAHWPVPRDALRRRVPSILELDTFGGDAWLGITPFGVTGSAVRGTPAIPWLSSFTELNVRTYVVYHGIPGIFFFSLDADSTVAVAGASTLFHLPYFLARMQKEGTNERFTFESTRVRGEAAFQARYAPAGDIFEAGPDTLERWLVERYCLYALDSSSRLYRADIHHLPWRIQKAEAEITVNTMAAAADLRLPAVVPLLHFSKRQDTLIWPVKQLT